MQDDDKLRLPVNPENYELSKGMLNSTAVLPEIGEVNIKGKPRLDTITLSSFFPNQFYPFCEYSDIPDPISCVELINKFMVKGQVRLMITGTDVNKIFYIENFTYGERDGTRDIYYTLELKEYKKIKIKTISSLNSGGSASVKKPPSVTAPKPRPATSTSTKSVPTTYTVKKGDTLWGIAKKFLGNGSRYPEIAKKNGLKNPNVIKVGQVLKI